MRRLTGVVGGLATALVVATSCSGSVEYPVADSLSPNTFISVARTAAPTSSPVSTTPVQADRRAPAENDLVIVDTGATGTLIDRRLFGTNVPAWLGPERLRAHWLLNALDDAGITTIRMPGGSWSNEYGWSACELRLDEGCIWDGAARPSDFAELLATTGLAGIWTVSINETAQSAAALVAFFNGDVDDERTIGVDREGVDWGTVGDWARVRAAGGNSQPAPIALWEVGNEVYGGRPDAGGDQCAPFGWENVWTCDGATYVSGDDEHDGYLDIRRAMLDVDPTIEVGAVGVADPSSWSNWGNEVIETTAGELDFYVVHQYGFDSSPSPEETARRAEEMWGPSLSDVRERLGDVPIAVTEYNLVSFEAGDAEHSMTTVANALFIADSIGQLARSGVAIANQWNLANGTTESGTDYGMVAADTGDRFPQFEAMASWGRAGEAMLPVDLDQDAAYEVYPTRRSDGSIMVIVLNPGDQPQTLHLEFEGLDGPTMVSTSIGASSPDADAFDVYESVDLDPVDGVFSVMLPPWSITEVQLGDRQ